MPKNAIQEAHAASLRSLLVCVTFGRLKTGGGSCWSDRWCDKPGGPGKKLFFFE